MIFNSPRESIRDYDSVLDSRFLRDPRPDRLAFVEVRSGRDDIVFSETAFRDRCLQTAAALSRRGVRKQDIVIIALESTLEISLCFWGALVNGATPLIYPTRTPRMLPDVYESNLQHLFSQVKAQAVIAAPEELTNLWNPSEQVRFNFDDFDLGGSAPSDRGLHQPRRDELIHLQTSSGTTGRQKIVPLTHDNVIRQMGMLFAALSAHDNDVVVNWMPFYHDGGLMFGLLLPAMLGIPTVTMSPLDWVVHPAMLFRSIAKYGGSLGLMPNSGFNHCARRVRDQDIQDVSLHTLRHMINAAERVYRDAMEKFADRFEPYGLRREALTVGYGMAENTLLATYTPNTGVCYDPVDSVAILGGSAAPPSTAPTDSLTAIASCGLPLKGVEITIRNEAFVPIPDRQIGEVCLRSPSIFDGYYLRPDLTDQHFKDGWYLTGDLGYLANGELYITGRKKDLIIAGGKNVYPTDIEEIVYTVSGVRPGRAAAFGVYDPREGTEQIIIVAETQSSEPAILTRIAAEIREAVARHSPIPAGHVRVTPDRWIIKTSSGKIARSANREKWLREQDLQ